MDKKKDSLEMSILEKYQNLSTKPQGILVGCSSGVDSMVLLCLLHSLKKKNLLKGDLVVCHVNYGLRGEESDADQSFIEAFCRDNDLACKILKVKRADREQRKGEGIQEWARRFRYGWFAKIAGDSNIVALAHHQDDIAETILLRMARGSGIGQLSGMVEFNDIYWRPLLRVSKQELWDFAYRQEIPHRDDSTNAKLDYSRNRIRHLVLKELEGLYPGATGRIAQTGEEASDIVQFVRSILISEIEESGGDRLRGEYLRGLPRGVAIEAISQLVRRKTKSHVQLSRTILYTTLQRILNPVRGASFRAQIHGGGELIVDNDHVLFKIGNQSQPHKARFNQHRRNIQHQHRNLVLEPRGAVAICLQRGGIVTITNTSDHLVELSLSSPRAGEELLFISDKRHWNTKELLKIWGEDDKNTYEVLRINNNIVGLFDGMNVVKPDSNGKRKVLGSIDNIIKSLN